jgi:hypothetical protein
VLNPVTVETKQHHGKAPCPWVLFPHYPLGKTDAEQVERASVLRAVVIAVVNLQRGWV